MAKVAMISQEVQDPEMAKLAQSLMKAHFILLGFSIMSLFMTLISIATVGVADAVQQLAAPLITPLVVGGCVFFVKASIETNNSGNMQFICIGEAICSGCIGCGAIGSILVGMALMALASHPYAENPGLFTVFGVIYLVIAVLGCIEMGVCIWGAVSANIAMVNLQRGQVFTGLEPTPVVMAGAVPMGVAVAAQPVVMGQTFTGAQPPVGVEAGQSFCSSCGTKMPADAKFCNSISGCKGVVVVKQPAVAVAVAIARPAQPVVALAVPSAAEGAAEGGLSYCSSCGAGMPTDAKFCTSIACS